MWGWNTTNNNTPACPSFACRYSASAVQASHVTWQAVIGRRGDGTEQTAALLHALLSRAVKLTSITCDLAG
jgi:hypothetical protein